MSVVEDEGFCLLLEYSEPRCSLPSRKYFYKTGIKFIINSTTVSNRYRHIHKAQASISVSGLKKLNRCIPSFQNLIFGRLSSHQDAKITFSHFTAR